MMILLLLVLPYLVTAINSDYDFIVVGSGAGGSAVAARLALNGKFSVLLIEMGGQPINEYEIPARAGRLLFDAETTYNYKTVKQNHGGVFNGGIMAITGGKMLGGTTSLNYMIINRGHAKDWDNYANFTGDPSWKYSNVLKYMRRFESNNENYPSEQHGTDGWNHSKQTEISPGRGYLVQRREGIGDPNGPQQVGFAPMDFAKKFGRRVTAYDGYIKPLLGKWYIKLEVLTNAKITQILFHGNTAYGVKCQVTFKDRSAEIIVNARKEVIVSAGTFHSPLLLQRSGIGPKDVLTAAKIPVLKDLPVGRNLQDHPIFQLRFVINNRSIVMDADRDLTPENWQLFQTTGDGPFSSTGGTTTQALLASPVAVAEGHPDLPDYQIVFCSGAQSWTPLSSGSETEKLDLTPDEVAVSTYTFMRRPKSVGSIAIDPQDPYGNPILDLGYFTDPRDWELALDSIHTTLRLFEETNAYKSLRARYLPKVLPACDSLIFRSNEYFKCFLEHAINGGCHVGGTNRMGRWDDPTAVVDSELRVIGIRNLRVVDASVQPFVTNANPQAAVYVIAEKAADMILSAWENIQQP